LLITTLTRPKSAATAAAYAAKARAVGHVEAVAAHRGGAGRAGQVDGLGEAGLVDVGEREQRAARGQVQARRGRCRSRPR
jgi:hypothetical protein